MRLGILGSGMIVNSALESIKHIDDKVTCKALWCRDVDLTLGKELKNKYQIPSLYTKYDEFLKDSSYDVVYVGLINSVHYEYTKKALEAGKNVICEKPFSSNSKEAKELIDLAKAKGLYIFEAIMLRYADNYDAIIENIKDLGKITLVQCNYSQYSSRFDKYQEGIVLPAFDPHLSGGSLYDINVYCLQFTIGLFGKPKEVHYFANKGTNGIDTSGVVVLDYESFKAICVGAKDSNSPAKCTIQGYKGYINVDSMPGMPQNITMVLNKQEREIVRCK